MLLDSMPAFLYVAFAIAAAGLCFRWYVSGQILDKPVWAIYLLHLPLASLIWAAESWSAARWISAIGNLLLICCAVEAARACGWWIIPPIERRWVLVASGGVGLWMASVIASVVELPKDQPWTYYLIRACAPACAIGLLVSAWGYQRIKMDRAANNSRNAWHVWLLMAYCFLSVLNAVDYSPPGSLEWTVKNYSTVTLRILLFAAWWIKVSPVSHRRVLPV
jgi:hypothetical protein